MNINVNIRVNENMQSSNEIAAGWVEIEDCIKFPVRVRKGIDKTTNQERMFVSYPQRKTDEGYSKVLYPHDKNIRDEIEKEVMESLGRSLQKEVSTVPITDVKVTLLQPKEQKSVKIRGIASIMLAGITINGIMIKESSNGMFVQMPQHPVGGEFRDTVYASNSSMQYQIKDAVLEAYEKEIQKKVDVPDFSAQNMEEKMDASAPHFGAEETIEESQEWDPWNPKRLEKNEAVEKFLSFYNQGHAFSMVQVLKSTELEVEEPIFTEDGEYIKQQFAVLKNDSEDILIMIRFNNEYHSLQAAPSDESFIRQSVEAFIYDDGKAIGNIVLQELKGKSVEEVQKNYGKMINIWNGMTNLEGKKIVSPEKKGPESAKFSSPKL